MFRSFDRHQGYVCSLLKLQYLKHSLQRITLLETFTAVNVFNNVILARNKQLPDDDRMIETCRSIFKSFNINNLSV